MCAQILLIAHSLGILECAHCPRKAVTAAAVKQYWQTQRQCAAENTLGNHNTTQKVNIFVKTKNVPKVLKCKINLIFFPQTWGSQPGEGWDP